MAARAKYFPLRGLFLEPEEDEDSEDMKTKSDQLSSSFLFFSSVDLSISDQNLISISDVRTALKQDRFGDGGTPSLWKDDVGAFSAISSLESRAGRRRGRRRKRRNEGGKSVWF